MEREYSIEAVQHMAGKLKTYGIGLLTCF